MRWSAFRRKPASQSCLASTTPISDTASCEVIGPSFRLSVFMRRPGLNPTCLMQGSFPCIGLLAQWRACWATNRIARSHPFKQAGRCALSEGAAGRLASDRRPALLTGFCVSSRDARQQLRAGSANQRERADTAAACCSVSRSRSDAQGSRFCLCIARVDSRRKGR